MGHEGYKYDDIIISTRYNEEGKKIVHIQKRLKGIIPSPVEIVFRVDELLNSGEYDIESILRGLCRGFPLYNLDNDKMREMLFYLKKRFCKNKRLIMPKELISLALLNRMDKILKQQNKAFYFKTKYLKNIPMGRRIYASRYLHENKYIVERGHVWERTSKEFNQNDFCIELNEPMREMDELYFAMKKDAIVEIKIERNIQMSLLDSK